MREKSITEDGEAVNAMGASSSAAGTGGVDTFDPLLKAKEKKKRKLRAILSRKPIGGNGV